MACGTSASAAPRATTTACSGWTATSCGDFADVAIEVARPGEAVRLIHVVDAAEPRYKPDGPTDFPGFVGPQRTVGEGRTNRLAGLAVVSVGDAVAGEPTYWREALIDMSGPGADATVFGGTLNLVL